MYVGAAALTAGERPHGVRRCQRPSRCDADRCGQEAAGARQQLVREAACHITSSTRGTLQWASRQMVVLRCVWVGEWLCVVVVVVVLVYFHLCSRCVARERKRVASVADRGSTCFAQLTPAFVCARACVIYAGAV